MVGKLFSLHNKAHLFHLQTGSYAMHKNLDGLYSALETYKDSIAEYLLGTQIPKRFGTITIDQVGAYSDGAVMTMLEEGCELTQQIYEWAESKKMDQLCNLAAELEGEFVKAKLFTTYK